MNICLPITVRAASRFRPPRSGLTPIWHCTRCASASITSSATTASIHKFSPRGPCARPRFLCRARADNFRRQYAPPFRSPYVGQNSLIPNQGRETWDVTAGVGVKLWQGAELWFDPEIDQGFGLSATVGVAGFPRWNGIQGRRFGALCAAAKDVFAPDDRSGRRDTEDRCRL